MPAYPAAFRQPATSAHRPGPRHAAAAPDPDSPPVADSVPLAMRLVGPGQAETVDLPLHIPGPGEIGIRIEGCGVCASNLEPWAGPSWMRYPTEPGALGHEGWGRIERIGKGVIGLAEGQRVAFLGERSYATHETVPACRAVPLPEGMDGPMPAEPLACALNILRRSCIRPGMRVAIVGIGFIGAVLTRLAAREGAEVIAVSRRDSSLALARDMGAAHVLPMRDHDTIIAAVEELTGGAFCDVVIEAVGQQWPLDLATAIVAERGRLVVAGYHQDGPRQVPMQVWNWKGLDVVNAHERDPAIYVAAMRAAVEAVAAGRIALAPLLTHRFPLDRLGEALDLTRDRPEGFVKAWVSC